MLEILGELAKRLMAGQIVFLENLSIKIRLSETINREVFDKYQGDRRSEFIPVLDVE